MPHGLHSPRFCGGPLAPAGGFKCSALPLAFAGGVSRQRGDPNVRFFPSQMRGAPRFSVGTHSIPSHFPSPLRGASRVCGGILFYRGTLPPLAIAGGPSRLRGVFGLYPGFRGVLWFLVFVGFCFFSVCFLWFSRRVS